VRYATFMTSRLLVIQEGSACRLRWMIWSSPILSSRGSFLQLRIPVLHQRNRRRNLLVRQYRDQNPSGAVSSGHAPPGKVKICL